MGTTLRPGHGVPVLGKTAEDSAFVLHCLHPDTWSKGSTGSQTCTHSEIVRFFETVL